MTATKQRGYADVHQMYTDLGWAPIKLKAGTKFPPPTGFTGHAGAYPSGADRHAWADEEPDGNTALRLADGFIGIDEDRYNGKTGEQTVAEAEKRWGALPYSPKSTSRSDGSGIRIYRVPTGMRFVEKLQFPELGFGGVEIIQPHHRYVMAWPSIHTSGQMYYWHEDGVVTTPPRVDDIPWLPDAWVDGLREPEKHTNGSGLGSDGPYNVRQALTDGEPSRRVSAKLGEAVVACQGGSRHDTIRDHVLGLLRCGKQGEPGVLAALTALQRTFVAAVANDRAGGRDEAVLEFRKFVFSDRTSELLADPAYDDPTNVNEVGAEFFTPDDRAEPEATTWEAIDLDPWLTGEHRSPQPAVGISRTDGRKLLYPGRDHTVFGETEAGKSWFGLECCAVEIRMGRDVVYIHYEEGDPGSTIERLQLLGVTRDQIRRHLRFVAPARPVRGTWLAPLLDPPPVLVIHDGVNEAMSLHGDDTNQSDGAATFRRTIIKPFLAVGATSLSCDHVVKNSDNRGRYAIGSGHKVNAIDGAAFLMENIEPFGRGLRGASAVYVTKDRPGQLRAHGKPTGLPGKTFVGVLAVDATGNSEDFLTFWPPKDGDEVQAEEMTPERLGNIVFDTVAAMTDRTADSLRILLAELRSAGHRFRDTVVRDAVDDLIVAGRLSEVDGKRGARGFQAVTTAARESSKTSDSATAAASASPIRGEAGSGRSVSASEAVGSTGKQSTCRDCKQPLLSPQSQANGQCERCRLDAARAVTA